MGGGGSGTKTFSFAAVGGVFDPACDDDAINKSKYCSGELSRDGGGDGQGDIGDGGSVLVQPAAGNSNSSSSSIKISSSSSRDLMQATQPIGITVPTVQENNPSPSPAPVVNTSALACTQAFTKVRKAEREREREACLCVRLRCHPTCTCAKGLACDIKQRVCVCGLLISHLCTICVLQTHVRVCCCLFCRLFCHSRFCLPLQMGSTPRSVAVVLIKWSRNYYKSREECCREQGNPYMANGCDCQWNGYTWDNLPPPSAYSRVFTDECDGKPSLNRVRRE